MTSPVVENGTVTLGSERARNINLWKDAEVWFSPQKDAQVNKDGTFDPTVWAFVGLLNTGSEIGQEIDVERNDIESFGAKKQMTDVKVRKDSRTFSALESNEVTYQLMWPGSTPYTDNGVMVLMGPVNPAKGVFAFKTVNSFGDVYIDITRRFADVYASGQARGDDGASVTEFTVEVMMDDKKAFYDRLVLRGDGVQAETPNPIRVKGVNGAGPIAVDTDKDGFPDSTDSAPNDPLVH